MTSISSQFYIISLISFHSFKIIAHSADELLYSWSRTYWVSLDINKSCRGIRFNEICRNLYSHATQNDNRRSETTTLFTVTIPDLTIDDIIVQSLDQVFLASAFFHWWKHWA